MNFEKGGRLTSALAGISDHEEDLEAEDCVPTGSE